MSIYTDTYLCSISIRLDDAFLLALSIFKYNFKKKKFLSSSESNTYALKLTVCNEWGHTVLYSRGCHTVV